MQIITMALRFETENNLYFLIYFLFKHYKKYKLNMNYYLNIKGDRLLLFDLLTPGDQRIIGLSFSRSYKNICPLPILVSYLFLSKELIFCPLNRGSQSEK